LGENWNRDEGAGYGRIFESTSIGVVAMSNSSRRLVNDYTNFNGRIFESTSIGVVTISNSCRRLVNDSTNFTAQTWETRFWTQFHVKDFTYKFHVNILRILQQFFSFVGL